MEHIRLLVQNMVVVAVLGVFLEMFLPQSEMRRYVRLVMGLLIIAAVLQAIGGVVRGEWQKALPEPALSFGPAGGTKMPEVLAAGKELQARQQEKAIEEYRRGLARQISALLAMSGDVLVKEVEVEIYRHGQDKQFGQVKEVSLLLAPATGKSAHHPGVSPVVIGVESGREDLPPEVKGVVERVVRTLVNFYNLQPSQVKVKVEMP